MKKEFVAPVTPTPPTDPRLEEWMLAVASNHVYKVAAWRERSAEFMQTQVIRLAESILRYSSEAGAAPKLPQPLALSHCMQELKAYIDNVIAERGRDNALSFLSLTRMESVIREALAAPGSTSGPTERFSQDAGGLKLPATERPAEQGRVLNSEASSPLIKALQRIVGGGTCECEHDSPDCCDNCHPVDFVCPECIAGVALKTWVLMEQSRGEK